MIFQPSRMGDFCCLQPFLFRVFLSYKSLLLKIHPAPWSWFIVDSSPCFQSSVNGVTPKPTQKSHAPTTAPRTESLAGIGRQKELHHFRNWCTVLWWRNPSLMKHSFVSPTGKRVKHLPHETNKNEDANQTVKMILKSVFCLGRVFQDFLGHQQNGNQQFFPTFWWSCEGTRATFPWPKIYPTLASQRRHQMSYSI